MIVALSWSAGEVAGVAPDNQGPPGDVNAIGYSAADAIDDAVRVALKLDWGIAPVTPRQPAAVE
jgi:hypothetical protein